MDGYHDLETIFYPVAFRDALEILPSKQFEFTVSGLEIKGDKDNNLCSKAYQILKKDFPELPFVKIWLHKHIPMGAGLGGGSADGAFTLKMLKEQFLPQLSTDQLISYAAQLGSDCPFFIYNKPCFATGRGELLNPINLDLSDYCFVIVYPGLHIGTAWAFSQITPKGSHRSLGSIVQEPIEQWRSDLVNDFEGAVLKEFPPLSLLKEQLYKAGAIYASMTGSGSAFYGIFSSKPDLTGVFPDSYQVMII